MSLTFIDFFAGIGGFRDGMEQAGHRCVGFCEFDKYAVASYTSMHLATDQQVARLGEIPIKKRQKEILKEDYRNGEWYANDVRTIRAAEMPYADCWCFGFPCQDISVAGKQLGFEGNRSSLFFEVMRLIDERKESGLEPPRYLFIENVKNLLSVSRGFDFAKVLIALDERGYDAEWSVLNSKEFGVPQNRERCFIIGHLRGKRTETVFPISGADAENCVDIIGHRKGYRRNTQVFDGRGITEALDTGSGGGRGHYTGIQTIGTDGTRTVADRTNVHDTRGIGGALRATDYKDPKRVAIPIGNTNPSGNGINGVVYSNGAVNPTITTNKGEGNKIAIPVLTPDRIEKRQNDRRMKENGDPSFTLTGQDRHGVAIGIEKSVGGRKLNVSNCLTAREDRGVSRVQGQGTAVLYPLDGSTVHKTESFSTQAESPQRTQADTETRTR